MLHDKRLLILTASEQLNSALQLAVRKFCPEFTVVNSDDCRDESALSLLILEKQVHGIISELSVEAGGLDAYSGVKLAQRLRKFQRYKGFYLFVGLTDRKEVAAQYSFLDVDTDGVDYLLMPVGCAVVCEALRRGDELNDVALKEVLRDHCQLADDVGHVIHQISNLFVSKLTGDLGGAYLDARIKTVGAELRSLRDTFSWLGMSGGAELLGEALSVLEKSDVTNADEIEALLKRLEEGQGSILLPASHRANELSGSLSRREGPSTLPEVNRPSANAGKVPDRAPVGYETILVADDDGYPPESISYLEGLNYHVEIVTDISEAESNITADPMAVLLCDQTFGSDPKAGRRLMALARQNGDWKLILALSGSILDASEVPEADGVCSGARAKMAEGARRLHEMICEWATSHP